MIQAAISIIFWPIMVTETSIDKHLAYQSLLKSTFKPRKYSWPCFKLLFLPCSLQ